MTALRAALAAASLAAAWATAAAAPLALPPPPRAQFTQHIGAALPLQQRFVDDDGTPVRLGEVLDHRSAVLLFGYYRCPMLCGVVGDGVLEALARARLADDAVRVVEIGIDPRETPADAAAKKAGYARRFGASAQRMHLLTGASEAVAALAAAAGFHYSYDSAQGQWVHPAGFLLLTPQGRVSRYFFGARFEAAQLKAAIDAAGAGRTGSPLQQLLLLCAHYDPSSGRNTAAAMMIVRSVCLGVCCVLCAWLWRRRRGRRPP